jgi:hypothetical protein
MAWALPHLNGQNVSQRDRCPEGVLDRSLVPEQVHMYVRTREW